MTLFFFHFVIVNDIIFFKLFAHFTHIIQSLNVEVFQFYKAVHSKAIEKTIRNDDVKYNRLKFLAILQDFRVSVFIKRTIRNV